MVKITHIKVSPSGKRIQLFLAERLKPFSISKETFLKLNLSVGKDIDLKSVKRVDVSTCLLEKTLSWLALRPRSRQEIVIYLEQKSRFFKDKDIFKNELLDKLNTLGLIDDEKFTSWWIEQRINFRPKSKRLLWLELKQKGVADKIAKEMLDRLLDTDSELQMAQVIVAKKSRSFNHLSKQIKRQKLYNLLARRGFSWPIIKQVIDEKS